MQKDTLKTIGYEITTYLCVNRHAACHAVDMRQNREDLECVNIYKDLHSNHHRRVALPD